MRDRPQKGYQMKWTTAWSYLPIPYNTTLGTVEEITQRTFFWNNLSGERVKVRFSNKYGKDNLKLEKVVIAKRKKKSDRITDFADVTCEQKQQICVGPGEEFYSDEIEWKIEAGEEIVLSIYIRERTNVQSACATWSAQSCHTVYGLGGDDTRSELFPGVESKDVYPFVNADENKADLIVGVSGINVKIQERCRVIAMFGDSITHMSYYSDALMKLLYEEYPGEVTVLNRGIGGNRILRDATLAKDLPGLGKCFGNAGIRRFETDLYTTEHPDIIFLLEGINDIMHPRVFGHPEERVDALELRKGLKEMIRMAHHHNSRICLGTIMPFHNEALSDFSAEEKIRKECNRWIREQEEADGIFDFAKALQRGEEAGYMADGLHIGDGLHPNAAGGEVMANLVFQTAHIM